MSGLAIARIAQEALAQGKKSPKKGEEAFGLALRHFLDDFHEGA